MKCTFNEYTNLHYPNLMIKGVMKVILEVNLGNKNIVNLICYFIKGCKTKRKT